MKRLPIRERKLKAQVVFVANISTPHYKVYGSKFYNNLEKGLRRQPNMVKDA